MLLRLSDSNLKMLTIIFVVQVAINLWGFFVNSVFESERKL